MKRLAMLLFLIGCGRVDAGTPGVYRYSWQAGSDWWHGEAVLLEDGSGHLGYPEEDPTAVYGTDFSAEWPWAVTWEQGSLLRIEAPAHGQYQEGWTFLLGDERQGLGITAGNGVYPFGLEYP